MEKLWEKETIWYYSICTQKKNYMICNNFNHFIKVPARMQVFDALQRQFRLWSFSGNCAASAAIYTNTHSCVCDRFIYSQDRSTYNSSSRKGRHIVGIYNSLTDTWMWKLGLRPRYSFSGNISFKFSAFVFAVWSCPETSLLFITILIIIFSVFLTYPSKRSL